MLGVILGQRIESWLDQVLFEKVNTERYKCNKVILDRMYGFWLRSYPPHVECQGQ
jgi:hypothetical protein